LVAGTVVAVVVVVVELGRGARDDVLVVTRRVDVVVPTVRLGEELVQPVVIIVATDATIMSTRHRDITTGSGSHSSRHHPGT
jgi:hypothetical protein